MRVKYEHGYTGATHMTKVFVKRTILFLLCSVYEYFFLISQTQLLLSQQVTWWPFYKALPFHIAHDISHSDTYRTV